MAAAATMADRDRPARLADRRTEVRARFALELAALRPEHRERLIEHLVSTEGPALRALDAFLQELHERGRSA